MWMVTFHWSLIDFNIWLKSQIYVNEWWFTNEKRSFWDVNGANAGGKEPFRFRRRSTSDAFEKAAGGSETGPRSSPPTYGMWSLTQHKSWRREEENRVPTLKRCRFDNTKWWFFCFCRPKRCSVFSYVCVYEFVCVFVFYM